MEGRILAYNYFCQKIVFNMCFDTINKGNIHFTKAYRNSWTLDARVGRWTLDAGPWTLDTELWMLDSGFQTVTIRQMCLPCPPSRWIRLNIVAWWGREKCLLQGLEGGVSKVSPGLWQQHENICEIGNIELICRMVVVTSKSHAEALVRFLGGAKYILRSWRVKAMGEGDHEIVCRWRQLAFAE